MAIRNDYLLDMIARFVEGMVRASGREREGNLAEAEQDYREVVGEVLDMDADTVLALAPASLVTMTQISAVDERLAVYLAYCLERLAEVAKSTDPGTAQVRREQARALADAFGFTVGELPPELENALSGQDHK